MRIVSLSYPVFRSWRTSPMDKTTAPHRLSIYFPPQGQSIATMQVLLPDYLHGNHKPPSLNTEDKISITPFPAGRPRHRKNTDTRSCHHSPESFPPANIACRSETLNFIDKNPCRLCKITLPRRREVRGRRASHRARRQNHCMQMQKTPYVFAENIRCFCVYHTMFFVFGQ